VIEVHNRGCSDARFKARPADYPVLVERSHTPREAVNRLVGAHRALLQRQWSS